MFCSERSATARRAAPRLSHAWQKSVGRRVPRVGCRSGLRALVEVRLVGVICTRDGYAYATRASEKLSRPGPRSERLTLPRIEPTPRPWCAPRSWAAAVTGGPLQRPP